MKHSNSTFGLFIAVALISACQPAEQKAETKTVEPLKLSLAWSTDTVLTTSESILYDRNNDILFVSCINGLPNDSADGDGFISKVSPMDGTIVELKWATGLNAPKGMGIANGKLYVADITQISEINLISGEITNNYPVSGAKFLNDISTDEKGNVFVSDSNSDRVHMLSPNGEVTEWYADTSLGRPNGLLHLGNEMMMVTFAKGDFYSLNPAGTDITLLADSLFGGDGIVRMGNDFLVSTWYGEIFHVSRSGKTTRLLDTRDQKINAADIEFDEETGMLFIPTFFDNRAMAYRVE